MTPRLGRLLAGALLPALTAACSPAAAPGVDDAPAARRAQLEGDQPAPPFRVLTSKGAIIDSADLIGRRATLVVFFTTWCKVCDRALPLVREALAQQGGEVTAFAVSLDDVDTWPAVPAYLDKHGLEMPVVRGAYHAPFVMDYDPALGIPVVVVIGKGGRVVDVQRGWAAGQEARLRAALEAARVVPPSAPPG